MLGGQAVASKTPAATASRRQPEEAKPGRTAEPAKPNPQELRRRILAGFQGSIESAQLPITYRFGILLVLVVMVALPIIYVAIIGLVGYLTYLHTVYDVTMLKALSGRGSFLVLAAYVAPIVTGVILVVFMIKPLFARPAETGRIRSLRPDAEPTLFAFVQSVCTAVGAPTPSRIDIDFEVNASAGFRRGIWSMLGNDLVLTIGLPLVAGMNTRQVAGVLGHEFGHFTQGAGMRLTYVIRSISWWFTRVVYQRDQWDVRLARMSREMDIRIGLVFYIARLGVWLTRKVLWVLMMVGHAVSGFMLRQMEFDADRIEARVAGSDVFESIHRRLALLSVASQDARADLEAFYREGRLGDNLPMLIMANARQMPKELRAHLDKTINESTTGLFDTHPADKDRIANARREDAPGIFHVELPASLLFSNFTAMAKGVTWDFYCGIFGQEVKPTDMHPVEDLLARQEKDREAEDALRRYFQGAFTLLRPVKLGGTAPSTPKDPRQAVARLKEARQKMVKLAPGHVETIKQYEQADSASVEAEQAGSLLRAGLGVKKTAFSVPLTNIDAVTEVRREAKTKQNGAGLELEDFDQAVTDRLWAALKLLHHPKMAARLEHAGKWQEESTRLVPAMSALSRKFGTLMELRTANASLAVLAGNLKGHEDDENLIGELRDHMSQITRQFVDLRRTLMGVDYPLDHAKQGMSIGEYALSVEPDPDDLGDVYGAGESVLSGLFPLYGRILARLVLLAERVETALGLPTLPEPPELKQDNAQAAPG
jgi:Zn-dependent protease with chaperone function